MLRIRRPSVGWMQNVSLDIILPATYIPRDMALLPIWITSGSCFALIHPGTNDVPPTTSRSRTSAIPSTLPQRCRRLACIYPGFISSRSCRSTRTDRKFLNIGWKRYWNLIRKFTVGAPFLDRLYFRSFSPAQDLQGFTAASENGIT